MALSRHPLLGHPGAMRTHGEVARRHSQVCHCAVHAIRSHGPGQLDVSRMHCVAQLQCFLWPR